MAAFGIGLSWLYEIFGPVVIVLWCVLSAFTALFAEMQSRAVSRGLDGLLLMAFTAMNWSGWEFIRAELFPLKFPWMTAGLAIGPNALLPWVGVYGAGVFVAFSAAAIAAARWRYVVPFFVLLLLVVYGPSPHQAPRADDPLAVKVAGLQMEIVTLDDFIKETAELPDEIQYVAWPEYGIPYDIRKNPRDWKLVQDLCSEKNITLTFGTQAHSGNGDDWRNIALTMDSAGIRGEHTKVHTVHFFDDGTPGESALPVKTRHGDIGTPVCFDCDYETVTRRMTAAGAEMFIVPIMDAGSWTARQHEQHAELFRIRACENGRWMFVCASSGVSQIIDPTGHVHARLPVLVADTLMGRIRSETRLTPYIRFGWFAPWCVLTVVGICWIMLLLPFSGQNRVTSTSGSTAQ
jgi:apolipoprotein N-acyltransferase